MFQEKWSKMSLDGIDIQEWTSAIRTNDASSIHDILGQLSADNKTFLINCCLKLRNSDKYKSALTHIDKKYDILTKSTSIELAIAHNSRDVTKVFLTHGLEVTQAGGDQGTLVHYIVHLCDINPEDEGKLVDFYQWFIGLVNKDAKKLLFGEDKDGMRPLELAAEYGFYNLAKAILHTKEVYLIEEENVGALRYQQFDITDYEGSQSSRSSKSPLAFITFMNEDSLSKDGISDLFSWMPLEQWYNMKITASWPLVIIWFILRFSTITSFYVLMGSHLESNVSIQNQSLAESTAGISWCDGDADLTFSKTFKTILLWYVTIYSTLVICLDISEMTYVNICHQPYVIHRMCFDRRNTVVSVHFHRVSQHILSWVFAAGGLTILLGMETNYEIIIEVINICSAIGYFGSVLYFLQLVPSIGYNVVTIQRMLGDLFHFSILFFLFVLPFARYFVIFFASNSNEGCIPNFSSIADSFYSSFTIMLNMVNFNDFDVNHKNVVRLAHFSFVFIIAILLVNFLIALMSNSASRISQNKLLVQKLERLQVAMILEFRLGWLLKCYYEWMKRRSGLFVEDKAILTNVELIIQTSKDRC